MNTLEKTIISQARSHLDDVRRILADEPSEDRDHEITAAWARLGALEVLAHFASGLSEEATNEMLAIEHESAQVISASNGDGTPDVVFDLPPAASAPVRLPTPSD